MMTEFRFAVILVDSATALYRSCLVSATGVCLGAATEAAQRMQRRS